MASSVPGSKKLKNTLAELESALSDWDKIPLESPMPEPGASVDKKNSTGIQKSPELPEEFKRRTRELLDKLKQQIDEL